ncbi:putative membrane protein YfcA [Actimicrobium sp. GrIS 1.19]|uniref:sulfite exporter TauE/SafE family protein n=1 Tax=Actimicrobium sp. GrIS 1.19 TaxID=3071708 RepID=UPI002DF8D73B|nr:putative membrane protein YfcA [Actimicrobium sp. GrIS 1.19]
MLTLSLLCLFAFFAGMIDAAVGGGGLIQIPALFNLLPGMPSATLLGTNKMASACGTAFAAKSYVSRIAVPWRLVLPAAASAFAMAFLGAAAVSSVPQNLLRPVVLALLVIMAIYTFIKKDFGALMRVRTITPRDHVLAVVIGGIIGFYDGLFGPGTGSFLIFLFIRFFAFDFVLASACSKVVNLATNVAALLFFIPAGKVVFAIAAPMAACNVLGALVGAWIAVKKGASFVRVLFLVLLVVLIAKLSWDLFTRG